MSKPYYTLLSLQDNRWVIEFGDYDRKVVVQEGNDMRLSGPKMKIMKTADKQTEIQKAVDAINSPESIARRANAKLERDLQHLPRNNV